MNQCGHLEPAKEFRLISDHEVRLPGKGTVFAVVLTMPPKSNKWAQNTTDIAFCATKSVHSHFYHNFHYVDSVSHLRAKHHSPFNNTFSERSFVDHVSFPIFARNWHTPTPPVVLLPGAGQRSPRTGPPPRNSSPSFR